MSDASHRSAVSTRWVDHIPLLWCEPDKHKSIRRLVVFLTHLAGTKEETVPFLQEFAAKGFLALSFDLWQHGERGTESQQEIISRVFANFRRSAWPIIGQSALDALKVIDWALSEFDLVPEVHIGGISMGGDISVTVAGLDSRIQRVFAVVATPDWLRPGMQDLSKPGTLLPPGTADAYAQYFYDSLNPMTHQSAFARGPQIIFQCGEHDTHVPPEAAFRFQAAIRQQYGVVADNVQVELIPGMGHIGDTELWAPKCIEWLTQFDQSGID